MIPNHLSGRPKLGSDQFRLSDQRLQDEVFLPLLVNEISAVNFRCWLELPIDASVSLLESRGVPRQVYVDEIVATCLQIDTLSRRVGADQDAQRLLGRVRVEAPFQVFTSVGRGRPGK